MELDLQSTYLKWIKKGEMIVRRRMVQGLAFLCVASMLLYNVSPPHTAVGEQADADMSINAYQTFVIDGGDMYVQADDGIWRRSMHDQKEERLVSSMALGNNWEISGDFSLFLWNHELALADWENGKLWRWTGSTFETLTTLQGIDGINLSYFITTVSQGDALWILNNGILWAGDIVTGRIRSTDITGINEIAAHPGGGIVAIRTLSDHKEVVRITTPAAVPETLAQLSSFADGGLACDGGTGAVYATVSGELSRLDGNKWTALRPLTRLLTWKSCAVYANHFVYADNNELYLIPFSAADDGVQLTIRGINLFAEDDQYFINENPSISIFRQPADHYCAEEVYQAIATGDSDTDLFLIAMSSGVRNLMKKGYLQSLSTSSVLLQDAARQFAFAAGSCQYHGEIYAFPYNLMLGAWCMKNEYKDFSPPLTLKKLFEFVQEWEREDGSIPAVAGAYSNRGWTRKDYAIYALKQFIMLQQDQDFSFNSSSLISALEQCFLINEAPSSGEAYVDTARNAVITVDDYNALAGDAANECMMVCPPALISKSKAAIPASMYIYVLNPHSSHQKEAIRYLEYLAQNRGDTANALLCKDAAAALLPFYALEDAQLSARLESAQIALDNCKPEDRLACEETLQSLLFQKEQAEANNMKWVVHPDALKTYQTLYAPNIDLQLNPLLENSGKSHINMWDMIIDCLNTWLEGQTTLEQCVSKLDTIHISFRREQ